MLNMPETKRKLFSFRGLVATFMAMNLIIVCFWYDKNSFTINEATSYILSQMLLVALFIEDAIEKNCKKD